MQMQPRAFFERAREAHALAVERVGSTTLSLDLAGRPTCITFASKTLADRLSPALQHRRSEPGSGQEALNILVWDTRSTGVSAPSPPWGAEDYLPRGHVRGFSRDGIRTAFHGGANVLSLYDESTATAIFWTPDGKALPEYQVGSPFLVILHWWAEAQALTLVHSGAVGSANAGVLLSGAGGSGKSTTALACVANADLHYVSDDYCLLDTNDGDIAHSVYNTGKLDDNSLELLPQYRPVLSNKGSRGDEKGIVFLQEWMSEVLIDSFPVKAIVLPTRSATGTSRVSPASPGEALRALAPSTIFQLTGAGSDAFAKISAFVRRVPSFHLELGRDMGDIVRNVKSILERSE